MAINLKRSEDQEFRNPLIFYGEAKNIDLNRVLLNLFMLIKYNGVRPKTKIGRKYVTTDTLVKYLLRRESEGDIEGFSDYPEAVSWWVMSNLTDLVNRGNPEKEALASLKAIHLDSYMFRNPHHARDYNISEQVFTMLQEEPELITKLKDFLETGWEQTGRSISRNEQIDLDTLGILKIVEQISDSPSKDTHFRSIKCLCSGQARIFCDDVRRLLIYQQVVPRHVLLDYLKTLIGIHVGLYLFKLFRLLPDWVARGERCPACRQCQVSAHNEQPFAECPYHPEFVVDCGDDPGVGIAQLAEEHATFWYARIYDYVRATFSINMALQFCKLPNKTDSKDIDAALSAIKEGGIRWEERFRLRTEDIFDDLDEEQSEPLKPILDLGLPPFETFTELVMQIRSSFHFKYHRQLLDTLFQRSRETGLIWKGHSRKHKRRFWLSSRLLETMVQLAVLHRREPADPERLFHSEPILIESFLHWLQHRYGFIINGVDHEQFALADISVHRAFRRNVDKLKHRLREIGFFNVLSDAYIMQRIRPRYPIE